MTDLAAFATRTTADLSDLLEVALFSLTGLLLSLVLTYGGLEVASALLATS